MDPMDYTFQQQPGSPAQGNSNSLHNNPASWLAPQSYLGQLPYHPGPFANPFVHQRPVQPSPGFSQPSQAPLQNSYSSPRHSGGAMMGDATHASSQTLGSWSMHAPVSAAPAPPNLNYGFPGNYDSFGGQPGWPGYMESISTGFSPYQSPPPAVNTPRHGTANASAAAGRHSLPRIQTAVSPASANARSQPSQSSSSTFSPSAAPFTPGQARYQTNPQPSPVSSSSGVASVGRTLSYGQYQQYSQSLDRSSLPSPAPERSRQRIRARRSYGARYIASDPVGENTSPAAARPTSSAGSHRRPHSMSHVTAIEDASARHMQLLRGAMTSKMVASKSALRSLQRVDMGDLADNEKSCVICYNDFGVETPEGVSESPLRLPKCKHVFGDFCIKKWLEDSDSCPYCRDKLHSEPKHSTNSARTFMNIMRMRGLDLPARDAEELYRRILNGDDLELTSIASPSSTGERRPPPDNAGEQQRRTRQRRSSASSDENAPLTPRNINIQRQRLPPTPPRLFSDAVSQYAPLPVVSQAAIQQRNAILEAAASSARASRRRAHDRQTQMASSANGSLASVASDGPLPNPLQGLNGTQHRRAHSSMSEMNFTPTRSYRGDNITNAYVGHNSVGGSC